MRKITAFQILTFSSLIVLVAGLTYLSVNSTVGQFDNGEYKSALIILSSVFLFYLYAILIYRSMLLIHPLNSGEIKLESKSETIYHVYLLFFLILFYPIIRSNFIPVPMMRIFYLLLGAKLGENTYSSGMIFDPIFVSIGNNSLVGQGALLVPHIIENDKLSHYPISIGDNVTIGVNAVIQSGVVIEDNALIAIGAVVKKNTHIKAGETWAGIPAKNITKKQNLTIRPLFINPNVSNGIY